MKNKKLILAFGLVFVLIFGGLFFFNETPENSEETEKNNDSTYTGNLIIGNPGLEDGWYISYEEKGSPGLIKKISVSKGVNCLDSEDDCRKLLEENKELAGERVVIEGEEEEDEIIVSKIEFLEEESCNFEFSDFKAQTTLDNNNNYKVDFSTRPEAEDFRTRIENAVNEGLNFAGNYIYAQWGCGTNCGAGAIINPESGEIVEYGLVNTYGVSFKKDSKLLIINPSNNLENGEGGIMDNVKSKYFLMQEGELLLLCEKTI